MEKEVTKKADTKMRGQCAKCLPCRIELRHSRSLTGFLNKKKNILEKEEASSKETSANELAAS